MVLAQIFYGSWTSLWISNSIVELDSPGVVLCTSVADLGENNRIGNTTCGDDVIPDANFRLLGVATGIDPDLADNGGSTRTHLAGPGSNVIDAGSDLHCANLDPANSAFLTEDQHGDARFVDGILDGITECDIGAVEFQ